MESGQSTWPAPGTVSRGVVHPAAFLDPRAAVGEGVVLELGAYVDGSAELGARVRVGIRAIVAGETRIGEDSRLWPNAFLGCEPEDRAFRGERNGVRIGDRCHVR